MAFAPVSNSIYDSASSSSWLVTKPTWTQDGDIMFALTSTIDYDVNSPVGWTLLWSWVWTGSTRFRVFYKIASSEWDDYTFTITSGRRLRINISAWRWYDITEGVDTYSVWYINTSNTSLVANSIDVTNDNSPVIFFWAVYNTTWCTFTPPDWWTEYYDWWTTDSDMRHSISYTTLNTWNTGNITAWLSITASSKWAMIVSLNPAITTTNNTWYMNWYLNA